MARNQYTKDLSTTGTADWEEASNADIDRFTFQARHGAVEIYATATAVKPPAALNGLRVHEGIAIVRKTLAEVFGTAGLKRLWVKRIDIPAGYFIDHNDA